MHKKTRKLKTLVLNRETVRNLDSKELGGVMGAFSLPPAQCGDSNHTCDDCPTYSCGLFRCL
ncbi:MAG TPA: hypothetical protein VIA62_07200 [Thermoanaerobaculia bacterium]|jgi:hypothetical protein|nr:hypothetical protein [Thermoanaerobaculia bacterium]